MKRKTMKPLFSAVKEALSKTLFGYMHKTGLLLCSAHVGVAAYTGNRYFISPTLPSTIGATYDAAGYGNTGINWTEITDVSDFPSYGPKRAVGTFQPIYGGISKFVGSPNYGSGTFTCADEPTDPGQIICAAAAATPGTHHSMLVLHADGERDYLDVIVSGWELAPQKENTAKTRTGMIEVCRVPINVAAT
jgi:hypothetical protein